MLSKQLYDLRCALAVLLGIGLTFNTAARGTGDTTKLPAGETPEIAMTQLVADMKNYAQAKQPDFQFVGNGAAGLLEVTRTNPEANVEQLIESLDGFLTESVFYINGGNGVPVPQNKGMAEYLATMFKKPLAAGKAVWTLDYLADVHLQTQDEAMGRAAGYVSMTAPTSALDEIPISSIPAVNAQNVQTVQQANNFLFLLNPERFTDRQSYLASLEATPYDALVLDLYYEDNPLTAAELVRLKQKPQGGRRIVLAYMSIGEAEDYRQYWQPAWKTKRPAWLKRANPDWSGNYKVAYWTKDWQKILYGSDDAYLDKILAAGFDGAFLDVMDAWQYFK